MSNVNFVTINKVKDMLEEITDEYIFMVKMNNEESACQVTATNDYVLSSIYALLKYLFKSLKEDSVPITERYAVGELLSERIADVVYDQADEKERTLLAVMGLSKMIQTTKGVLDDD